MTDDNESFAIQYQRFKETMDREHAAQMAIVDARVERMQREAWERSLMGRLARWVRGWWA